MHQFINQSMICFQINQITSRPRRKFELWIKRNSRSFTTEKSCFSKEIKSIPSLRNYDTSRSVSSLKTGELLDRTMISKLEMRGELKFQFSNSRIIVAGDYDILYVD